MTTPAAKLAEDIATLKKKVQNLERAPRLKNASVEGQPLPVFDGDQVLRQTIGQQPDGTYTVVDVNGPPPPVPSAPIIEERAGTLVVTWDGTFADGVAPPLDWDHVEVHVSITSGYTPTDETEVITFHSLKGGSATLALDDVPQYVVLQAVSTSRTESEPTAQVEGTPLPPTTGAGGVQTFLEDEPPVGLDVDDDGALWYDTNDNNHPYRWDGGTLAWISIQDGAIADAQTAADTAQAAADAAQATADAAHDEATSDGLAPATSPDVTLRGGWDILFAQWTPITNADPVTYDVYVGIAGGFTADPTTWVGETVGSAFVIKNLPGSPPADPSDPDPRKLLYDVPYYVKVKARDADGSAAAGGEGVDTIYKVTGENVAEATIIAAHILGNTITGDKFAARIVLSSEFWTSEAGQRVGMTPLGFFAYKPDGSIMLKIPTDSPEALYDGELIIRGATVLGGLSVQSAENEFTADSVVTLMRGISAPSATPQLQVTYDYLQPSTASLTDAQKTNSNPADSFAMGGPFDLNPAQVTNISWEPSMGIFEIYQIRSNGTRTWYFDTDGEPTLGPFGAYFSDLKDWEVWSTVEVTGSPTKNGSYALFRYIPGGPNSWWLSSPFGNDGYVRINTAGTPVVGYNSTLDFIYIAEIVNSTHLTFKTYNTPGTGTLPAPTTAWESNAGPWSTSRKLVSVTYHPTGFDQGGAARYLVTERDGGNKARLVYTQGTNLGSIHPGGVANGPTSWASADVDAESFEAPGTNRHGMLWDGTNFWHYDASGFLFKHEGVAVQWNPNAVSSTLWAKQAFTDTDAGGTGTHTTAAGVARSITINRRGKIRWLPPDIPDNGGTDDPNACDMFTARGTTEPANASFHLQATGTSAAPAPIDFTTLATVTATPPTTSTFPNTNPALIRNDDDTLQIDATGLGKFTSLFVGSAEVVPARPYYFGYLSSAPSGPVNGTDATVTTWVLDGANSQDITYSAGILTFTRGGVYRVRGQLWWNGLSGGAGTRSMTAYKNGTSTLVAVCQLPGYGAGVPTVNKVDEYVRFAAGDTVRFRMGHTQGTLGVTTLAPIGTDNTRSFFQLMYVRP